MTDTLIYLQSFILRSEVTRENFNFILEEFGKMERTPDTKVIWDRFRTKYAIYFLESIIGPVTEFDKICELQRNINTA